MSSLEREYREVVDCISRVTLTVDRRRDSSFVTAYVQVRDCRTRLAGFRKRHSAALPPAMAVKTKTWLDCMGRMMGQLRRRKLPEECL